MTEIAGVAHEVANSGDADKTKPVLYTRNASCIYGRNSWRRMPVATMINVVHVTVLTVVLHGAPASLHGFTQATAGQAGAGADALDFLSEQRVGGGLKEFVCAASPVATVCKVVLDVVRKEASGDWQIARRGETLSSGDRVKTGEKSVTVIKFKDHSLVRVHERSLLTINETTKGSVVSRSVNLETGGVGFKMEKQGSDEEFRFTSPISVASIRGTEGQFISGHDSDTLTVIEGVVLLTNSRSFESVEVRAGNTGIANPDGTLFVRMATLIEVTTARCAVSEDGETTHAPAVEGIAAGLQVSRPCLPEPEWPDGSIQEEPAGTIAPGASL